MKFNSKPGLIVSLTYLGIFVLSGIYTLYTLIFHPANSEFCGLFSMLITQPWSMMMTPILDLLGYITWYDHFAIDNPLVYGLLGLLPFSVAALINAAILYLLFSNTTNKNLKK